MEYTKPPLTYEQQIELLINRGLIVSPTSNFKNRLFDLLGEYRNVVELRYMGFPTNWKEESMWKI